MNELTKEWWQTLNGVVHAERKYKFSCDYDFTGNRRDRALSELHAARNAHVEATRALMAQAAIAAGPETAKPRDERRTGAEIAADLLSNGED